MILWQTPAASTRAYDVLRDGKVVGTSVVTRAIAADRSGKESSKMTLNANEATVRLETATTFGPGGVLKREIQDVFFSRDLGRGTHLQTIADFDAEGASVTATERGARKVSRLEAPKGVARGNPWRFGRPAGDVKPGTTFAYTEFDLTAVRWRRVSVRFVDLYKGMDRLEMTEGARTDRMVVDREGNMVLFTAAAGFTLRPQAARSPAPRPARPKA